MQWQLTFVIMYYKKSCLFTLYGQERIVDVLGMSVRGNSPYQFAVIDREQDRIAHTSLDQFVGQIQEYMDMSHMAN